MTAPGFLDDGLALCAETDPEAFFPQPGDNGHAARAVCGKCELSAACLDYALTNPVDGIWGGTSTIERTRPARADGRSYAWRKSPDVGLPVTDDALRLRARRAAA